MPRFSFVKTEVSSVKMENSEGACPTPRVTHTHTGTLNQFL